MTFQMLSPNIHICTVFVRVKVMNIPASEITLFFRVYLGVLSSLQPSGKHVDVGVKKGLLFVLDEWSTDLSFCINYFIYCTHFF